MSNDIILLGYALKRKADGAYLGSRSWILKKDALPNLYESPNKVRSLYKVRPNDIFPAALLRMTPDPSNPQPWESWFSGRCWRKYPQKFKELQDFAEKEFEIVKVEIRATEVL